MSIVNLTLSEIDCLERDIYSLIGFCEQYGRLDIPCLIGLRTKRNNLLEKIRARMDGFSGGLRILEEAIGSLVEFYERYGTSLNVHCLVGLKKERDRYINIIDGCIIKLVENGQD